MSQHDNPAEYPPVPAVQAAPQEQARAKKQPNFIYTREQTGHSLTMHLLFGAFVLWIPALYITFSKRHFWHA